MSVRADSEESGVSRPVIGGGQGVVGAGTGVVVGGAVQAVKEALPPRHRRSRRKEEESGGGGGQHQPMAALGSAHNRQQDNTSSLISRGAQFDLEEASFPPLPGKIILKKKKKIGRN